MADLFVHKSGFNSRRQFSSIPASSKAASAPKRKNPPKRVICRKVLFRRKAPSTHAKKTDKMVHIENTTTSGNQEAAQVQDSGAGFPDRPVLQCDHNPPAELDPYIYVVLTSL
jgi:hypothetical protein